MVGGYILVMKDDASKYLLLHPTKTATPLGTVNGLLSWFALFGVVHHWVSDQGTHFRNEVVAELKHRLGAQHQFTTAQCPWANGTVENAMKQLLPLFRVLLSEWRLSKDRWMDLVPLVQMAYNHSPSPSLGGAAPVEAMMGMVAMLPSDMVVGAGGDKVH
jgi:hypothetical protein